jgi:CRP/FNR family cyclic AMP-dependent transcriptional regulator
MNDVESPDRRAPAAAHRGTELLSEPHELERRSYRAGETIFRQGEPGDTMYIIESGEVQIRLFGDMAQAIPLHTLRAGEFFGELSLFDGLPRSASAVALTDVVVLELEDDAFLGFLASQPRSARAIFRTMSTRLRETNAMLSGQAARNVDEEFERSLNWTERLSDAVAQLNGSWTFIGVLVGSTLLWFILNSLMMIADPPDPYPYQFFNLVLGILVGLQGPLIMMSQNRQAMKERARADTDYRVNLKNELNIEKLLRELTEVRSELRRLAPRD